MKKSPLIVFTGLAVAAVAGVLGMTRDRWMGEAPVTTAAQVSTSGETVKKTEEPATAAATSTTTDQTPAVTTAAEQTPVTPAANEQAIAVATEQSPATTTATEQAGSASAEQSPAAESAPEQVAVTTAAEQAVTSAMEQVPAAEPAAEQVATATTEQTPAVSSSTAAAEQTVEVAANAVAETPDVAEVETKPSFDTVRVEKTGEAVIAGTAEAGSEIVVKLDGETIGTAVANAEGAFVVVPEKALPQGSGALTIESKAENETTAVKSEQSVAVIVPAAEEKKEALVAIISPNEPTKVLQKPAADVAQSPVSLDAVDYDAAGNIVFNGRAAPGATVRLYVDNSAAGDAQAGGDGRWTFTGATAMAPGNHMLRVDAIDAGGKVTSRVELPFVREDLTKVAAATPAVEATEATATTTTIAATTAVTAAAAVETLPKEGRVVIQPGNNLWRISKVIYGDGMKYSVIFEANKDLIRNPDMIFPGQIFETPDVVPPEMIDPEQRDPIATAQ